MSLGVLEAELLHGLWHWDEGLASGASVGPGGILHCAGSERQKAFINGLSVEMSDPDTAAGGGFIAAPLGGTGQPQGQGKLLRGG